MEAVSIFEVMSEKTLHHKINPGNFQYCPTMDLIALGSIDDQVLIFRLNGQRVYCTVQKAGAPRLDRICWKPNGQMLATSWGDGTIHLIGTESGKIAHQFSTGQGDVSGITCMGWASNFTGLDTRTVASRTETWLRSLTSDALPDEKGTLDLPRDLTLIDIETNLPKLSVLTASNGSDDVFSSRSSLDSLFRPFDPKDKNVVDIMVVGTKKVATDNGTAHLVLHAYHPGVNTHSLLMRNDKQPEDLYFVPMDLRFMSFASSHLPLLASRSTALQNLLRYIDQVQVLMASEWRSTQELPGKFLKAIDTTLKENGKPTIVHALYHSVASGHTFPIVRAWLVNDLAERGHKRWDKIVTTGLENIRRLIHENMLPALDRCSVILSRLSGIAKFQGSSDGVGYSSQQIARIEDTIASLHLVSARILSYVVEELELFAAFSSWLRCEIDRLASESTQSSSDEAAEKAAYINHSKVFYYLQHHLCDSPLKKYLEHDSVNDHKQDGWKQVEEGAVLFDLVNQEIRKQERRLPYMTAILRFDLICRFLFRQCSMAFDQIAESEKRNVRFGLPLLIGQVAVNAPIDMKICVGAALSHAYIAFVPEDRSDTVQIVRISFTVVKGISNVRAAKTSTTKLDTGRVKDIKFFSDTKLLVLWGVSSTSNILSIPFSPREQNTAPATNSIRIVYTPLKSFSRTSDNVVPSREEVSLEKDHYSLDCIANHKSFVPSSMQIRCQGPQEPGSNRVALVDKDQLQYKILRLDTSADNEDPSPGA